MFVSHQEENKKADRRPGCSYLPPFTLRKQLLRTHPPKHLLSPQWPDLSQMSTVLGVEAVTTETGGGEKQAEVVCVDQSHWVTESTKMGGGRADSPPPHEKTHI